ncbi:MAG: hypothetical protein K8T89_19010, partial [Planctomycetes bacterium]|nr:hypothetical protein [Planctomycetota bacterium]
MALEFNCPHCGAFYRLDEKFAGKMGRCKNAKCKQSILIPLSSTTGKNGTPEKAGPVDAEKLAAAAFSEEPPPKEIKKDAPPKQIPVTCQFCDHKYTVDLAMAGKNSPCPECGKIVRVPKPVDEKPADWRNAASSRPSMAKVDDAPAGAWDAQRKGVSAEALRAARAHEVDEEEEPRDRWIRRLKRAFYGMAFIGMVAFLVLFLMKSRREGKQERWMEMAIKEVDDDKEGSKKPEFRAAIQRYAGEYFVRAVKNRDELQEALKHFDKARDGLQGLPSSSHDRNGMLVELGVAYVVCGGDATEINEERRLPWDKVHPLIRKSLDKIPSSEHILRARSMRMLARKLAEKNQ